jgi:uncharacterized protein YfaP (DUF2135 family)
MPKTLVRNVIALAAVLALAACVASDKPVAPESNAVEEAGLIGTWRYAGTQDDVWSFIHVLQLPDRRVQIVAINELRGEWAVVGGHVSQAGPRRVLNLRLVSASEPVRVQIEKQGRTDYPYSFVMYRLEGKDRLVVAQPFTALQKSFQNRKLSGESADNALFVADDPERMVAALGSASDADLFAQNVVYLRVPAP